jgi:hypothetical protein
MYLSFTKAVCCNGMEHIAEPTIERSISLMKDIRGIGNALKKCTRTATPWCPHVQLPRYLVVSRQGAWHGVHGLPE